MDTHLAVTFTRTFDRCPLAVVHNLPGQDADLFPWQLRALASALLQAADACEATQARPELIRGRMHEFSMSAPPPGASQASAALPNPSLPISTSAAGSFCADPPLPAVNA